MIQPIQQAMAVGLETNFPISLNQQLEINLSSN
jgi:hypothetical protein